LQKPAAAAAAAAAAADSVATATHWGDPCDPWGDCQGFGAAPAAPWVTALSWAKKLLQAWLADALYPSFGLPGLAAAALKTWQPWQLYLDAWVVGLQGHVSRIFKTCTETWTDSFSTFRTKNPLAPMTYVALCS